MSRYWMPGYRFFALQLQKRDSEGWTASESRQEEQRQQDQNNDASPGKPGRGDQFAGHDAL